MKSPSQLFLSSFKKRVVDLNIPYNIQPYRYLPEEISFVVLNDGYQNQVMAALFSFIEENTLHVLVKAISIEEEYKDMDVTLSINFPTDAS